MLDQFGLVARWDDMADKLIERYKGKASRIVMYLAKTSILENPSNLAKMGRNRARRPCGVTHVPTELC